MEEVLAVVLSNARARKLAVVVESDDTDVAKSAVMHAGRLQDRSDFRRFILTKDSVIIKSLFLSLIIDIKIRLAMQTVFESKFKV